MFRREKHQAHSLLQHFQKDLVLVGTWSKLFRSEGQGRSWVAAVASPDELDELQPKKGKLQRLVLVKDLRASQYVA